MDAAAAGVGSGAAAGAGVGTTVGAGVGAAAAGFPPFHLPFQTSATPASATTPAATPHTRPRRLLRTAVRAVASLVRDGGRAVGGVRITVGAVRRPRRPHAADPTTGIAPVGRNADTASASARHVGGRAAGSFDERRREDRVEARGQAAHPRRERGRRRRHVLVHEGERVVAFERRPAREDLVRDDGERVAVRRRARGLALRLLGRHVERASRRRRPSP